MRRRWSRIAAVLSALAVVLGATACSVPATTDELLIYNAQHESLTKEWIDAFTKETGIKVTYRQGGDTELGNQLIAEGDSSPADVFLTENSPAMAAVEKAGLFADLDADDHRAGAGAVPSGHRQVDRRRRAHHGVRLQQVQAAADQLPKSMMDLSSPRGRAAGARRRPRRTSRPSSRPCLQLKGEQATAQWLAGMKTNAEIYNDNIATMKAVNAGEVDGGIIYHYYWFRDQAKTKEISGNTALHYFKNQDPGAFVSLSGGGVLKSSKKKHQAQQFLQVRHRQGRTGGAREGHVVRVPGRQRRARQPRAGAARHDLQAPAVDPSTSTRRR